MGDAHKIRNEHLTEGKRKPPATTPKAARGKRPPPDTGKKQGRDKTA